MSRESTDDLVDVLFDKYSGAILTVTSERPVVVRDLVDRLGMSRATAYRRVNDLVAQNLLKERTWIDKTGDQRQVYEANFLSLSIQILNGFAFVHIVCEDGEHVVTPVWGS